MYDDGAIQRISDAPSLSLYRPLPSLDFRPQTTPQPALGSKIDRQERSPGEA